MFISSRIGGGVDATVNNLTGSVADHAYDAAVNARKTLEKGKQADLIVVASNPLENVAVLKTVGFVMKGGVVHKTTITP